MFTMICAAVQVHKQRVQAHLCRIHRHVAIFSARVHLAARWRSPAESSAGRPRQWLVSPCLLSLSSDGLRIVQSAFKAICACKTSARHFLKASASTNLDTLKTFCCVVLGSEHVRGCYAGVYRLMHELIDSIHSWDEESDEHAMVDMLASFPQERFEVCSTTLLLQPLSPSHSTFSSCLGLYRVHDV